ADVVRHDAHGVAHARPPVCPGEVEHAVLLRHRGHDDIFVPHQCTEALTIHTAHRLAAECLRACIDHCLTRDGGTHYGREYRECAIVPFARANRRRRTIVEHIGTRSELRYQWHLVC